MQHRNSQLFAGLLLAAAAYGQSNGPAILSRGEAPSAMKGPEMPFQPYIEIDGVYNTGLTGVAVNSSGNVANESSAGIDFAGGMSGSHDWRHTSIGLTYRGSYVRYFNHEKYNTTDQSMLLSFRHDFSRHVALQINNSFGIVNSNYGLLSTISQAVSFDPSQSYLPTTNFFDNRTIFASSMASLVIQKSTRLSYSLGGGAFTDQFSSSSLYSTTGLNAAGDVQYRMSRRMTIGGSYMYAHFLYSNVLNSTDVHGVSGTFAYQLSRWWEFTGYAGAARLEAKFIQSTPVDPAIAAIIGISQSSQVIFNQVSTPNLGARLSRTFHKGVLTLNAAHGITPGNGLFLTSSATTAGGGYTYTGLRRWSFAVTASYQDARSYGNVAGTYGGVVATANLSRQLTRGLHAVVNFSGSKYDSSDFSRYNLWVYSARIGLGWTPSDVSLRIW